MATEKHSFKDYLLLNKRTYDFKIKVAGDCPDNCTEQIQEALTQFVPESCSQGIRTPIQELQQDFPDQKNISATIFEVTLSYPVTSTQVRTLVANRLNKSESWVKVRNPHEEKELSITTPPAELSPAECQSLVGDKRTAELLKGLKKAPRIGTQITGVNGKLLAKKSPKNTDKPANTTSTAPSDHPTYSISTTGLIS